MPLYEPALALLIPDGIVHSLALFTTAPGINGTGGVEASYTGYSRPTLDAWASASDVGGWYRANNKPIVFPAVTGAPITVHAWGIYRNGLLLASGPMMDSLYQETPQLLLVGDQARFLDAAFRIRGT